MYSKPYKSYTRPKVKLLRYSLSPFCLGKLQANCKQYGNNIWEKYVKAKLSWNFYLLTRSEVLTVAILVSGVLTPTPHLYLFYGFMLVSISANYSDSALHNYTWYASLLVFKRNSLSLALQKLKLSVCLSILVPGQK